VCSRVQGIRPRLTPRGLTEHDDRRVVGWPDIAAATCWETALTPVYSSLTHALAEALVDVLWFVEGSEDEQTDPDEAVKLMEGVAHLVSKVSNDQRHELLDLLGTMAQAESDPVRREFLEGFPEDFGLLDDAV
jgi:hypothetical protein